MEFLKKRFSKNGKIYKFNIEDKTTKKVTEFYKKNPFPNYSPIDNKATILNRGNQNLLAHTFKKFIGLNKKILEVGCGTGQLSIFFSIGTNNQIVGLDPTEESLKLASDFSELNKIENVNFVKADIFDDVLKDDFFDYIWCNGVLHHTKNPYEGFKITLKSLKMNGYILIGLYNKIGRLRTKLRAYIYKLFGKKIIMKLDPILRNLKTDSEDQINAWIQDQYIHPVESCHTIGEVLNWFDKNNIQFISSIPKADFNENNFEEIFEKKNKGTFFSRLLNQVLMLFSNLGSDGGLFVVVGKKIK